MKLEYLVVAAATVAAIVYYAKFDRFAPKHTEAEADKVTYYVDDCEVDADFFA